MTARVGTQNGVVGDCIQSHGGISNPEAPISGNQHLRDSRQQMTIELSLSLIANP